MPTPQEQAFIDYLEGGRQTDIQNFTAYLEAGRQTDIANAAYTGYTEAGHQTQAGAKAILMETLDAYGLSSLAAFVWEEYLGGVPIEQIMLDMRQREEYKTRFPAMAALASRGEGISEAQYINYETSAKSIFKQAGLPSGFYDSPDDFAGFLTNSIALPELQERVQMAQVAVFDSNPEALQALSDYYSIGGNPQNLIGDLTAYFIDPNRAEPLIKKQWVAAQTGGIAARTGYGALSVNDAERIGDLGFTPSQTAQSFAGLAQMSQLFSALPGENLDTPTRDQGIRAAFDLNAEANAAIQRQARRRAAPFQGSGGFAQTQGGYTGVG